MTEFATVKGVAKSAICSRLFWRPTARREKATPLKPPEKVAICSEPPKGTGVPGPVQVMLALEIGWTVDLAPCSTESNSQASSKQNELEQSRVQLRLGTVLAGVFLSESVLQAGRIRHSKGAIGAGP